MPNATTQRRSLLSSITWGSQQPDLDVTVYFAAVGITREGYDAEGFNAYEKAQFFEVFDQISDVTGLTFSEVNDPEADFVLILDTDQIGGEFLGYFNPPDTTRAGLGVFDGSSWSRTEGGDLDVGGYSYITIMHEVLHGLGLAHPHDRGGSSGRMAGVSNEFDDYGSNDLNQGIFTTMSYNSGYHTGSNGNRPSSDNYGYEAGPMALDIGVLQSLYGTGGTHRGGDNTYHLPNQNGKGTFWQTIWDTGGTDKIRYDGSHKTIIDLRAATLTYGEGGGGYISAARNVAGGYTIANGVIIEDAVGGSGKDMLIGNGADNHLRGRSGLDHLIGRAGDDFLIGGPGADRLNGGIGTDILLGGSGADLFIFSSGIASGAQPGQRDKIMDFGLGHDQIKLAGIDADLTHSGNQAFDFIGNNAFDAAGQIRVAHRGDDRLVQMDRDGDGIADIEIMLRDASNLNADDFIL